MNDWYPVTQYGADRRAGEANDERLHEKARRRGGDRSGGSGRSGSPAATPKGGSAKLGVCMTCHEKVDWVDDKRAGTWIPYDHKTTTRHRCATK
jgi:hypothetical protein